MSRELLEELIKQSEKLTLSEKHLLANHLLSEIKPSSVSEQRAESDLEKRKQHIQWIKDHQTEYAGKYVALDGYCLVGQGKTFPEAYDAAIKAGVKKPFVTHIFPPDSTVFGGW